MDKGEKRDVLTGSLLEKTFRVPVKVEWGNERPWIRVKSLLLTEKNKPSMLKSKVKQS